MASKVAPVNRQRDATNNLFRDDADTATTDPKQAEIHFRENLERLRAERKAREALMPQSPAPKINGPKKPQPR